MIKEQLLKYYEENLRFGTVVYKKINPWIRALHGFLLCLPIAILAWPSLGITKTPESFQEGWWNFLYYMFFVAGAALVLFPTARWMIRQSGRQLKKIKELKIFYHESKIDYDGFKGWQQDKLYTKLDKEGFGDLREVETLYQQLGAWMQRERFALIGYITVMAALGLPVWSAYLSVLFSDDMETALDRMLMLIVLMVFTAAMCVVFRTLNDFYNSVFSKFDRVSELRDVVERIVLNIKRYQSKKKKDC